MYMFQRERSVGNSVCRGMVFCSRLLIDGMEGGCDAESLHTDLLEALMLHMHEWLITSIVTF